MDELDDFGPAQERTSWTDDLEFTSGSFDLSSEPIRYFMTSVKLSALGNHFKLIEDIPGSARWGYNAIFQRDIDDERVEHELLNNYLFIASKFKFFNPLTIALLPYDGSKQQILGAYPNQQVVESDERYTTEMIGGVKIRSRSKTSVGYISWDLDRIVGAAIDGQHRLSALMKYAVSPNRPLGVNPSEVKIPVILLLFQASSGNILPQVREIFVDINKNAEPVSTARRVLLDDRDPFAVLARDLIKENNDEEGLPYEMIDWKRETPNPVSEHQITTVTILYEIVKHLFQNRLSFLESELDLNAELTRKGLLRVSTDTTSFEGLSKPQMDVALGRFRGRPKKFVLDVLSNIKPFKEFIHLLENYTKGDDPINIAFRDYLFQPVKKRSVFRELMLMQSLDPAVVVDERLLALRNIKDNAKDADLFFLSIGQRALFYNYRLLIKIYESEEAGKESTGQRFAADLNELISKQGLFSRTKQIEIVGRRLHIWQGVCLRGENVIVNPTAIERLAALIVLCIAAKRLQVRDVESARAKQPLNLKRPADKIVDAYKEIWERRLEEEPTIITDDEVTGNEALSDNDFVDPVLIAEIAERRAIATVDAVLAMAYSPV